MKPNHLRFAVEQIRVLRDGSEKRIRVIGWYASSADAAVAREAWSRYFPKHIMRVTERE